MASPALPRDRASSLAQHDRAVAERPPLPGRRAPRPASTTIRRTAGRYTYAPRSGTWWWSPEMFALHGVPAGTAEASTDLLLRCLHHDDRNRTQAAITGASTEGRPFTVRTRVVGPDGRSRAVVLHGEPETSASGEVTAVHGIAIDVSECPEDGEGQDRSSALEAEVGQMRAAMASRATIEQAKGILMLLTSCSDQVAFELLAHISSHTHRKVREVALSITESASGHSRLPDDVRAIVRDACPPPASRR